MEWMWAAMGAPADGQGGGTNTAGCLKAFAGSTGSILSRTELASGCTLLRAVKTRAFFLLAIISKEAV
jgi:hypothetical protein